MVSIEPELLTEEEFKKLNEVLEKQNNSTKELSDWDKKIISLIKSNLNKRQLKERIKDDVISENPTASKREIRWQIKNIVRIILLRRKNQKY